MMISNIGIIGLGSIGKRHARIVKEYLPNVKLHIVRSGKGPNLYDPMFDDVPIYDSVTALIKKDVDAVIICSPSSVHIEQSNDLIKANIPILIEKPLSNNLDKIHDFQKLALNSRVPVLVGYCLRHSDSLNKLGELLSNNVVGDVSYVRIESSSYLPNWRPDSELINTVSANKSLGGGVLLELSHELEYAIRIFGPFIKVYATMNGSDSVLGLDVEESVDILLTNQNNINVSIHLDFCNRALERSCRVYGNHGILLWDGIKDMTTLSKDGILNECWAFDQTRDDLFKAQLEHFIKCISGEQSPLVPLNMGVDVLKLIDKIWLSNDNGREELIN
jgi:predicted dehydrogenase